MTVAALSFGLLIVSAGALAAPCADPEAGLGQALAYYGRNARAVSG